MSARTTAAQLPPRRQLEMGHAEVFAVIFALGFVAARFVPLLRIPYTCPLKALTGIPCAACGMTHAFVHVAHGAFGAAFGASPLGALAAVLCWAFVVADAARLAMALPLPRVGARTGHMLARAGLLALIANWVYLVVAQRP